MSQRNYTPEEKAYALTEIRLSRNNIALVSARTGIPERTLREWRRLQRIENGLPPDPTPAAAANQFAETSEAIQHVYDQFVAELVNISDTLPEILSTASPYNQLMTLMRMIDRLEKLQMMVPPPPRQTIRIEYVDPDGSVHAKPPWERRDLPEGYEPD